MSELVGMDGGAAKPPEVKLPPDPPGSMVVGKIYVRIKSDGSQAFDVNMATTPLDSAMILNQLAGIILSQYAQQIRQSAPLVVVPKLEGLPPAPGGK